MYTLILTLASAMLFALSALPAPTAAPDAPAFVPCRGETAVTRRMIEEFLAAPDLAYDRTEMGVPTTPPSAVRLLGRDGADEAACAGLTELQVAKIQDVADGEPTYDVAFYAAEEFYFAVATIRPHSDPEIIRLGLSTVFVYDRSLRYVGGVAW